MSLSSLRLLLLARIAGLLRRWLHGVTSQLDAASPSVPPAPRPTIDPRRPAPPDHWVELVRQHAPQLLDPVDTLDDPADVLEMDDAPEFEDRPVEAPAAPRVIAYRAKNSRNNPPPLLKPSNPRPIDVAKQRGALRPLRLEAVSARALDAVEAAEHAVDVDGEVAARSVANDISVIEPERAEPRPLATEQIGPDFVRTTMRSVEMADAISQTAAPRPAQVKLNRRVSRLFAQVHLRRHPPAAAPAQPIRAVDTRTEAKPSLAPPTAPMLPFERQQIRETVTSIPGGASIASVRTSAGQALRLHQERTNVPVRPSAPAQMVLRPTLPPLNLDDVTPDRWPSLPDEPTEAQRDPSHRAPASRTS